MKPCPAVSNTPVTVGMIGLGTVGTGTYKVLSASGLVRFKAIAVGDTAKKRDIPGLDASLLTTDAMAIVNDPEVQVVIEVVGGVDPAKTWLETALKNGKHVVTANKELMAKHGKALFQLASEHGVQILLEGAVAGGIPIILPLKQSLAGNRIEEIAGILNGTTNYILTKMMQLGWGFDEALKVAQEKGFAEADPTADVEGHDAAYKISILAALAFNGYVDPKNVHCEGITKISAFEMEYAKTLGYTIKLLGLARREEGREDIDVRVHPMLVPVSHPLAGINNEYNAVWVKGHAVGEAMFSGRGAGELPTASAVSGDVLALVGGIQSGSRVPVPAMQIDFSHDAAMMPIEETHSHYYIRVNTTDKPGVIGHLGLACGDCGVSLQSVVQKETNADETACIVLITHKVSDKQLQAALKAMRAHDTVEDIPCVLRVLS
ncbi:MAG: homoserine dehydrogenase [Candidatus Melainabacteria bacterium]